MHQQQLIKIFLDFPSCLVHFFFAQVTSIFSKMRGKECVFTTFGGINVASLDIF